MSQKAIIHKATRVIRRLTIDDVPSINPIDEEEIELLAPIDLAGGFWKLDAQNKKVLATDQEIDDADVDEARVAIKMNARRAIFRALVTDLADNGVTLLKVQNYFKLLKESLK